MHTYDLKDISLETSAEKTSFCEVWPTAKSALQLLQAIIKNPVVKSVIGIVITTGDSICS